MVHNGASCDGSLMPTGSALIGVTASVSQQPHIGQPKPSGDRRRNNSARQASSV